MSSDDGLEKTGRGRAETLSDEQLARYDEKWGCLTRTLESITGQKATRKEKVARINQLFTYNGPDRYDLWEMYGSTPDVYKQELDRLQATDTQWQIDFINHTKETNTPMGQAL